ncbi:MAG: tetratricopeptide repeat protein [Saccharospirillaceae bacterium]|nr:tetratricopeptide repeat protein [Colwellia sp.]NRB77129.1 tetratricopeptide repeat protein [Saccharospirillaceae bacterium]
MSIDDKINILFYLFGFFLAFYIFTIGINLKRTLFPKLLDSYTNKLTDWDNTGEHETILDNVDRYIDMFPGDTSLSWAKARALFKLNRLDEAKEIFTVISISEPLWKEDAEKYIVSISEKSTT